MVLEYHGFHNRVQSEKDVLPSVLIPFVMKLTESIHVSCFSGDISTNNNQLDANYQMFLEFILPECNSSDTNPRQYANTVKQYGVPNK